VGLEAVRRRRGLSQDTDPPRHFRRGQARVKQPRNARMALLHLPETLLAENSYLKLNHPMVWASKERHQCPSLMQISRAAVAAGASQSVLFAVMARGATRLHRNRRLAALAGLSILVVTYIAYQHRSLPYPEGMDADRDRLVSISEWTRFHATNPTYYGGYDEEGYISGDEADYYEREFRRVDCDGDSLMNAYEYEQLRWNMRWCESPLRPASRWWK